MLSGEIGMDPKFTPGEHVRVKTESRPGHHRTPGYVQGRTGVVAAVHGKFPNPESMAYGGNGLPEQFLYLVVFDQHDLGETFRGTRGDTVCADIYEHWLEPA